MSNEEKLSDKLTVKKKNISGSPVRHRPNRTFLWSLPRCSANFLSKLPIDKEGLCSGAEWVEDGQKDPRKNSGTSGWNVSNYTQSMQKICGIVLIFPWDGMQKFSKMTGIIIYRRKAGVYVWLSEAHNCPYKNDCPPWEYGWVPWRGFAKGFPKKMQKYRFPGSREGKIMCIWIKNQKND